MVSVGSKALPQRKHKFGLSSEDDLVPCRGNNSCNQVRRKPNMGKKAPRGKAYSDVEHSARDLSGGKTYDNSQALKLLKHNKSSASQASFVRKQVDPETAQYFAEIANAIESTEIDLEERSVICGNALEETRGKELELATDYIISHTLQSLLEGSSVDHLCSFLRNCSANFSLIAMDRSGSHVAETALKSLALHLDDAENHSLIEETLTNVCQMIVVNPVDVMCNCYGSHVLRSLLCFCKGVPLEEFHGTKSVKVLAGRLNFNLPQDEGNSSSETYERFPALLNYLVVEILNAARDDIETLKVNQYSSLVLQIQHRYASCALGKGTKLEETFLSILECVLLAALKLLVGHDQELLQIINVLLGSCKGNGRLRNSVGESAAQGVLRLMEEPAYSRLMEVILEVSPETLYNELLSSVFRNSLFQMASQPCANFVLQALISHAKCKEHVALIWEELGTKFKDLLQLGRPGVVASLIAASQKLHSHEKQCCQALASAAMMDNESPICIVPRILFLDRFFNCEHKSSWSWPSGIKMHVIGSLILQSIFRFSSELIDFYIISITSMDENHVLEASKDPSGSRVIEAFLMSSVSAKNKRKLVAKLRGHFGELSVHPSGSFTVDKCFDCSSVSMRETIVSELLPFRNELLKTKQGPYILKKLDVDGFAKRPDQWKSRQASKQSSYEEFYAAFGPKETKSTTRNRFLADNDKKSQPEKLKEMRKEIQSSLPSVVASHSAFPFLSQQGSKRKFGKLGVQRPAEDVLHYERAGDDNLVKSKTKRRKGKKGLLLES